MIDTPENTFTTKGTFKLCSERAHELVSMAQSNQFADELDQMLAFHEFFTLSEGQKEFIDTLKFIAGKPTAQADIAENEVIHVA